MPIDEYNLAFWRGYVESGGVSDDCVRDATAFFEPTVGGR